LGLFKSLNSAQGPWWLSGTAHVFILVVALQLETPEAWPWALLAMAVVSFFAWLGNYRRYRQIHDLPTSKVASAAQGYVELVGRGDVLDGTPVISRLSQRPCCWYRYQVEEETDDNKWKIIDKGNSIDHFLLVDDTGTCVVSPDGAEIVTQHHKTWSEGRYRHTEWLLLPNNVIYALGEFVTRSGNSPGAADEHLEIGQLITEWKRDQQTLLQRFDLNEDGTIDLKEWEMARLQARREVRKQRAAQLNNHVEGVHLLRKPADGRLFLLASEMPDTLGRRYRWWSWVHLLVFVATGIGSLVQFSFK